MLAVMLGKIEFLRFDVGVDLMIPKVVAGDSKLFGMYFNCWGWLLVLLVVSSWCLGGGAGILR